MLALTDSARDAVQQMVEEQNAPRGSGLRIAAAPAEGPEASLSLDLATEPSAGDTVVEDGGARCDQGSPRFPGLETARQRSPCQESQSAA